MQGKRELERTIRVLALKVAQVIVQSRLGETFKSQCEPNSFGVDWFNLSIQDLPEILAETKRSLGEESISSSIPMCVEISVKTIEAQSMVLETWSLGLVSEQRDPAVKLSNSVVYSKIGMLLKSLLTVSRMIPAYKISRRQNPDCYSIFYRIFMGEPQPHRLGDRSKRIRVGQLSTELGTIHLSVSYRTNVTFPPFQKSPDIILLKNDNFQAQNTRYQQNKARPKISCDIVKVGAFVANKQMPVNEENDIPFGSLLSVHESPPMSSSIVVPAIQSAIDNCDENNDVAKLTCSLTSANDFIMVDLKTPFANTSITTDLGIFYRECQNAPQLKAFTEEQTLEDQIDDLTKQLEQFETNLHIYEDVVETVQTKKMMIVKRC